ncbi:hypothetical protein KIN20_005190 [Parelaphostrongylus tenuis]|uniref:Uncharacterized protein n=1 Tax=Parelaphostrongylus tenuis TaxID=148309 RepID=A0AAD5M2V6_PARTN|nr:hypothetical protein KIN20_005190 [Parelaphostrongylus tenuis]
MRSKQIFSQDNSISNRALLEGSFEGESATRRRKGVHDNAVNCRHSSGNVLHLLSLRSRTPLKQIYGAATKQEDETVSERKVPV